MNREMHKVKENISEFRLNVDCVASTTYCCIWPQIQRETKTGMMTCSCLLFGALFLSKSAHCLFLFMQKPFFAERLTHKKPTDPSTLKPSMQDQVAMNTSNLGNCLSHFRNYPPNSALLTDFFINTSPLMNESVFPVSQSESSSYISHSSFPKQPVCPRHVSKTPSSPKTSELSFAKSKKTI